jgi:hypothetical protein
VDVWPYVKGEGARPDQLLILAVTLGLWVLKLPYTSLLSVVKDRENVMYTETGAPTCLLFYLAS